MVKTLYSKAQQEQVKHLVFYAVHWVGLQRLENNHQRIAMPRSTTAQEPIHR